MEIDNILEEDLMAALDGLDMSDINSVAIPEPKTSSEPVNDVIEQEVAQVSQEPNVASTTTTTIDGSSADIVSLLKELLNNKSLEITIRVKDN